MKGLAKKAIRYAEGHGYRFERQNAKGFSYYRNSSGHEIGIGQGVDERGYQRIVHDIDRACGIGPDLSQKRHPDEIKTRQARHREEVRAERARHLARLEELTRQKSALLLNGAGSHLTLREVTAIERLIEAEQRHHRDTVQQMTSCAGAA